MTKTQEARAFLQALFCVSDEMMDEIEAQTAALSPSREELSVFKVGDRVFINEDDFTHEPATIEAIDLDAEDDSDRIRVNPAEARAQCISLGLPVGVYWGHLHLALAPDRD
jgi:transcription antitermination factor NusG